MSSDTITDIDRDALQSFYDSCRLLLKREIVTQIAAQKSFEECLHGLLRENAWMPTHISPDAAQALIDGKKSDVQRAHGTLVGRLDRSVRTGAILTGPRMVFDEWLTFYKEHDKTVILTKKEHGSKKMFSQDELIVLPPVSHCMFSSSGFSFKSRKSKEIVWLKNELDRSKSKSP